MFKKLINKLEVKRNLRIKDSTQNILSPLLKESKSKPFWSRKFTAKMNEQGKIELSYPFDFGSFYLKILGYAENENFYLKGKIPLSFYIFNILIAGYLLTMPLVADLSQITSNSLLIIIICLIMFSVFSIFSVIYHQKQLMDYAEILLKKHEMIR